MSKRGVDGHPWAWWSELVVGVIRGEVVSLGDAARPAIVVLFADGSEHTYEVPQERLGSLRVGDAFYLLLKPDDSTVTLVPAPSPVTPVPEQRFRTPEDFKRLESETW